MTLLNSGAETEDATGYLNVLFLISGIRSENMLLENQPFIIYPCFPVKSNDQLPDLEYFGDPDSCRNILHYTL